MYNQNSGWGQAMLGSIPFTTGRVFIVADNNTPNLTEIDQLYTPDEMGVERRHATVESALEACGNGTGDIIIIAPGTTPVIAPADLAVAQAKGVRISQADAPDGGVATVQRAADTLPQSAAAPIFQVIGLVRVISIIGIVTTAIQNQANNTKLIASPATGSDVDLCTTTSTANAAVGTKLSITGNVANALVVSAVGAPIANPAPIIVDNGTIDLSCAASNTGEVRWIVQYEPVNPGSVILPA